MHSTTFPKAPSPKVATISSIKKRALSHRSCEVSYSAIKKTSKQIQTKYYH